ncbi:MAG: dipeptidase [Alphaproteobacteria bacterium]|nr:dipeptidase [Alphaproteobacteria bacterium]
MSDVRRGFQRPLIIDALQIPTPERRWFEEWKAGGVGCVHITLAIWENATETQSYIGKYRRVLLENADLVELATSAADIERIAASGRTAVVFGFQNTAPVEHDIELFGAFRDLGVCIMQLTYNLQNYIGCGYWEAKDTGVSSRFGKTAIEEMNRVGILIDLSHCGERTTLDAIEMSARPVSITHANPREFVGSPTFGANRLKTTEAIKALAARKGVIGLSPNRNMVRGGAAIKPEDFVDMVAWTVDQIGIDAVGMGTDYCPGHPPSIRTWWRYARWSREKAPAEQMKIAPHEGWQSWFSSPAHFQNIVDALSKRYSADDVAKLMGGNWLRMFREGFVPAAAAKPAGSKPAAAAS